MSLAAISKHIAILARAGLVRQEKRGRIKWCGLNPDALKDASIWIEGFGQFEGIDLDGLEALIEEQLSGTPSEA